MKVRGLAGKISAIVMSAVLLTGCNAVDGLGRDIVAIEGIARKEIKSTKKSVDDQVSLAKGYTGHRRRLLFKPPSLSADTAEMSMMPETTGASVDIAYNPDENLYGQPSLPWNDVGSYQNYHSPVEKDTWNDYAPITPRLPSMYVESGSDYSDYNKDVTVFSIDSAMGQPSYAPSPVFSPTPLKRGDVSGRVDFYGQMLEKFYFAHGSSSLTPKNKSKLNVAANEIKSAGEKVNLTVVGHASKRVEGVKDPVRRQMINLEMAQKRANSVVSALKKSGVKPSWIETVSKGDEMATGNESTDRRVDLYMAN